MARMVLVALFFSCLGAVTASEKVAVAWIGMIRVQTYECIIHIFVIFKMNFSIIFVAFHENYVLPGAVW